MFQQTVGSHKTWYCVQREQKAAALLTGPSEVSSSSSHAVPDYEKQQLLERIQQLEAAGHGSPGRWQGHNGFADDEEHIRYTHSWDDVALLFSAESGLTTCCQ